MLIYLSLLDTDEEKTKFEKLYAKYKKLMICAAYDILNDSQFAEDAVHEAFIRIAKNFSKVGEIDCSRTTNFVVIIVKNVARTMLEKEGKWIDLEESVEIIANENTELEAIEKVVFEDLVKVIDKLPAVYKETTMLFWLEGYSIAEVASILNISINTAKKRIQRGRKIVINNLLGERRRHNG